MDNRAFQDRRNASLPWGYWLHVDPGRNDLIDEDGNRWESVRHCLWNGRLGMPGRYSELVDSQLEFMLTILAAHSRDLVPIEERVLDLCEGSWTLRAHYENWLEAVGLLTERGAYGLTAEGRAVLLMLASTRSTDYAGLPIGLGSLGLTRGLDGGATREYRERVLAEIEARTTDLPFRFVRDTLEGRAAIKLLGARIGSNMPLSRTLWAIELPDTHARDRLFAWMALRVERWQPWGSLANEQGAQALSEHFLQLALADQPSPPDG